MKLGYFSSDISEFIRLLSTYNVKYLIVGGEAVIYYGYPRLTGDVDFFYGNSAENTKALFGALIQFWNGDVPGLKSHEELKKRGYVIQFGVPPNRIDLMNEIEGVTFEEAWKEKKKENLTVAEEKIPVYFIGLKHLILNKKKTGRGKDLEDLQYLKNLL